jgi:hypothetical protein
MSLRLIDSFDYYASGDINEKWIPVGTVGISAGNGAAQHGLPASTQQ